MVCHATLLVSLAALMSAPAAGDSPGEPTAPVVTYADLVEAKSGLFGVAGRFWRFERGTSGLVIRLQRWQRRGPLGIGRWQQARRAAQQRGLTPRIKLACQRAIGGVDHHPRHRQQQIAGHIGDKIGAHHEHRAGAAFTELRA